jgi:signal transduction histidine kinase
MTRAVRPSDAPGAGRSGPIGQTGRIRLVEVVRDLHDSPGYYPAHDQVVAIAVRPLAEQVFRWQQRLTGSPEVEPETDHVEWFPARLRHILDNLFANALRHRDPAASGAWVAVWLCSADGGYELRVSHNGAGPPPGKDRQVLDLSSPAAQVRAAGLGPGWRWSGRWSSRAGVN